MSGWTARRLGPDDAAIYQEHYVRALKEVPSAFMVVAEEVAGWPVEKVQKMLAQPTFAAFEGDELAGIVALRRCERGGERHKGRIGPVYVSADQRGKGIAKKLMELALEQAAQDFEQVTLGVESGNIAALRLYESLGFVRYGHEPRALKVNGKYYDIIDMIKWLDGC